MPIIGPAIGRPSSPADRFPGPTIERPWLKACYDMGLNVARGRMLARNLKGDIREYRFEVAFRHSVPRGRRSQSQHLRSQGRKSCSRGHHRTPRGEPKGSSRHCAQGRRASSRLMNRVRLASEILGAHRWGAGPTAVALKQQGPWTYGVLANHIWSFAETSSLGPDVNTTFIQPFIGYTTRRAFTTTINTELTYNWLSHRWIIPINLLFSQVVTIAGQPISLQAGPRYYATTTDQGARWGVRLNVTPLFPAK